MVKKYQLTFMPVKKVEFFSLSHSKSSFFFNPNFFRDETEE
jgi:hypothetical protein